MKKKKREVGGVLKRVMINDKNKGKEEKNGKEWQKRERIRNRRNEKRINGKIESKECREKHLGERGIKGVR